MVTQHPSAQSTNRRKGPKVIRAVRTWCSQRCPLLVLQMPDARRGGTSIRSVGAEMMGKRDESARIFPPSFTFLSPCTWPLSRSSGSLITQTALGWPCFSLKVVTAPRVSQSIGLSPGRPGSATISESYLIVFIGSATTIWNGTDGLGESTA